MNCGSPPCGGSSGQDIETTQRLQQAGEIMGITVLDHIIFNRTEYFSFLESDIEF
jgi:DNA repair protein RadC